MFSFDELIWIKKLIDNRSDKYFLTTLPLDEEEILTNIEKKLVAFKVPQSNKGTHR